MREHDKQAERQRLKDARTGVAWRKWGPYLSERQWGSVRENISRNVEAWNDVTHDQSRSRAYISGEDGIAGWCDANMLLCFGLGMWNGKDPMLKERMFGLTNSEGNHGEDVKEYYFYQDSTPTHSYARMLYKYPQAAFPYEQLVAENARRTREDFEFELMDTGVFDEDRYWDVQVEFAKGGPEDTLIRVTATNRGPEPAVLHLVPQLWYRNTWAFDAGAPRPGLEAGHHSKCAVIAARHEVLGQTYLYCEGAGELLFTDNETNKYRLWGQPNDSEFQKDGINDHIVNGRQGAVNPNRQGTKSAFHSRVTVAPGQSATVRLRLTAQAPDALPDPFGDFDRVFSDRKREADEFYGALIPATLSADAASVVRQGYGSLLWTKQAYVYDVETWLKARGVARDATDGGRNQHWFHLYSTDVISMPDKWEYPWFAAWDLAFHAVALGFVDPDFAREQLSLMLLDRYQHPNGALPAYEWNFDDVNPPVHAWATLFNYRLNRESMGDEAIPFLKKTFHMLVTNFTWWINRKDRDGRNLFEGGFLGLDNIGVFDRSAPLPTGGYLEQADGTAWMAFYAQNMLDIALELALVDSTYEPFAVKFYEHIISIAAAINRKAGAESLWDDEDGFFYDVLRVPGQFTTRLKVRTLVGLLPLCAVSVYRPEVIAKLPSFVERVKSINENRPELLANISHPARPGAGGRFMLSLLTDEKLRRVLARMLDATEFLGDHGIRSVSRVHKDNPYRFESGGREYRVGYLPAESDSGMFGGNSNWRGPIWAPINALIIRALVQMHGYYGDDFKVECPTGSGQHMNLYQVAEELANRMSAIFLLNHEGRRPVYGGTKKFVDDPLWRDNVLFYEYYHGDNGAGLGASHQTGWSAVIPALMHLFAMLKPEMVTAPDVSLADLARPRDMEAPGASPVNHPLLYQVNTRVFLQERSVALKRPATLDDVTDAFLDDVAGKGFGWVWFLGVWQTGRVGREISRTDPKLVAECRRDLPDLREQDITGSPFAIVAYRVNDDFGGDAALARLRDRMARRGLKLLLDFVPNHTGRDHPWVTAHPEYYVHGSEDDLERQPQNYARVAAGRGAGSPTILAFGRDPYFDGWPDTFQLNYRHAGFREAQIAELGAVAQRCDGVRCDMAMLLQPEIIQKTWGDRSLPSDGSPPKDDPFWLEAIGAIRRRHPGFVFIAEVYWDMEWELQQAGFDYTYDKRLYDRLLSGDATQVREHLCADGAFQDHSMRFLENHDEARAATAFLPPAMHKAAGVVAVTARGLRFFYEGEFEGRRVHVSMHLGRRPWEPVDDELRAYYGRLLEVLKRPELHDGEWRLADVREAWQGNQTRQQLILSSWQSGERRLLVAVNYGPAQAQAYVATPGLTGLQGRKFTLVDLLSDARYERSGDDLASGRLYLDMPPWGYNVFELS